VDLTHDDTPTTSLFDIKQEEEEFSSETEDAPLLQQEEEDLVVPGSPPIVDDKALEEIRQRYNNQNKEEQRRRLHQIGENMEVIGRLLHYVLTHKTKRCVVEDVEEPTRKKRRTNPPPPPPTETTKSAQCTYKNKEELPCLSQGVHRGIRCKEGCYFCEEHRCKSCRDDEARKMQNGKTLCNFCVRGHK